VAAIMSRSYSFGPSANDNGNVLGITNCRDTNRTQNFAYDSPNRILQSYTQGSKAVREVQQTARLKEGDHYQAMTMNVHGVLIFFGIVFLVAVRPIHAQNELIIQEQVSVSRALAGRVDIQITRAPAIGAKVELFSPDWQTVLASTTTDKSAT